jgi:NAD(P)-dependent dehydrogenase (short-subunit alcohol dehydrogenase family)
VTEAGGVGIPVRVDHTIDAEVAALFARVRQEQKRLDVLVNVLTGQPVASWKGFAKLPLAEGRAFVDGWIWPHIGTCWHAVPLMVTKKSGLIVEIIEQDGIGYHGQFFFDLMEIALKRLAYALAQELAPKGICALAITPGFMRTEAILEKFGATEANWRHAAETHAEAKRWGFIASETPCFVGRAVAALAADPKKQRKSGGIYSSGALAEEYGFDDVDGTRPNMNRYMKEHFPQYVDAKSPTRTEWKLIESP